MNTEAVYAEVFARLQAIPGFVTCSRRLKHWNDVPKDDQPALFMAQGSHSPNTKTGQPSSWDLRFQIYVYAHCGDEPPGPIINPLIDAICNEINAIHPVTGRTTLQAAGVEYSRVSGAIETDEGTLGEQAMAIIPVEIRVA